MPRLPRSSLIALLPLSLLLAFAPSCGGTSGDQTTKFVGAWTFESGALTPVCPFAGLSPFSLAGLGVTFAKVDDATISLTINTGCVVHFVVNGNSGTVAPKQTCALDVGGALGLVNISVTSWSLALSGDRIDCDIAGMASFCTASGPAVLVRGTSDAGTSDAGADAGTSDAGASDVGTTEAGASDAGTDAPLAEAGDAD